MSIILDIHKKIEAQAARIKELEAALCEETEARSKWYCEADRLKEDLVALRSKIENAEVVAWQTWISGAPANTFHNKQESELHFAHMNRKHPDDSRSLYSLIRKEDLL